MAGVNILFIEPDLILLEQYDRKLRQEHTVYSVRNAQSAVDILDNKDIEIDLTIMDLNIGANNGIEVLHEIRSYDDWISMPVFILSSVPESRIPKDKLEKYGVREFLYKPQTAPNELLKQVNRLTI